jgi:hypothetical protein
LTAVAVEKGANTLIDIRGHFFSAFFEFNGQPFTIGDNIDYIFHYYVLAVFLITSSTFLHFPQSKHSPKMKKPPGLKDMPLNINAGIVVFTADL